VTITADRLEAARRAIDEAAIARRGPYAAIMAAPSARCAERRASLVLGMHRWGKGHPPARPYDVLAALGTWRLLNIGEGR